MSFRIGKVEHAANISFGLEKSKGFHFFVVVARSGIPLSSFGQFLLNPSKKKQTQFKQTLPSDLRSNIYNNQMEYQIYLLLMHVCCFFFCVFFFLQTDTTELKPVFGSSICKTNQSSLKTTYSVPDAKRNSGTKPQRTHAPILPFGPTLFIWKSSNSSPAWVGCTHGCGATYCLYLHSKSCCFHREWSKSLPL